jgi:hypothetical protein
MIILSFFFFSFVWFFVIAFFFPRFFCIVESRWASGAVGWRLALGRRGLLLVVGVLSFLRSRSEKKIIFLNRFALSLFLVRSFFSSPQRKHAPRGLPAPLCCRGLSSSGGALVGRRFVLEQQQQSRGRGGRSSSKDGASAILFVDGRRLLRILQPAPARGPGQPRPDAQPGRVGRSQRRARGRRGPVRQGEKDLEGRRDGSR